MTTIRTTTTTYTSTTTTVSNTPPSRPMPSAAQISRAISELGQLVNASRAQTANAMPSGDSMQQMGAAPMNLSGGQQAAPMDAYGAAKVLADNFRFIEGMGVNGKGKGSGDGLIGPKELEQIVRSDSGASPQMKAAAQFLLDNGPARASIGKMTQDNLQSFASAAPPGSGLTGAPNLMPQMSSAMMSMLGGMGSAPPMAPPGSLAAIAQNTINAAGKLFDAQAQMMGGAPAMGGAPMMGGAPAMGGAPMMGSAPQQAAPMDAYGAAKVLADNFRFIEGMGVNGKGKGSGDGLIGPKELEQIVRSDSGASPQMKAAAQFLLDNGPARASIGKMTEDGLKSFASAAPPGSGSTGAPSLMPQMSTSMMSMLGGMGSPMGAQPMPMGTQPMPMSAQPMAAPPMPMMSSAMMSMLGRMGAPAMDAGKAATVLQKNFDMLSHGKGTINMEDLKKAANPANGYPADVQAAARFLVNHGGKDGVAGAIGEASGKGRTFGPFGILKVSEQELNKLGGGTDIGKDDLAAFLNKNASV